MRVVIGGSSGFGSYVVERCVSQNIPVCYTYRNAVHESQNHWDLQTKKVFSCKFNLSEKSDTKKLVSYIKNLDEEVVSVIICASSHSRRAPLSNFDWDEFQTTLKINVVGTFEVIKNFVPLLENKTNSSITILSSKVAHTGGFRIYPYTASKGALRSMLPALARELAEKNIKINMISPAKLINSSPSDLKQTVTSGGISYQELYQLLEVLICNQTSFLTGRDFLLEADRATVVQI